MPKLKHWVVTTSAGEIVDEKDQPTTFRTLASAARRARQQAAQEPGQRIHIYECVAFAIAESMPVSVQSIGKPKS